jgi:hypothetical protein
MKSVISIVSGCNCKAGPAHGKCLVGISKTFQNRRFWLKHKPIRSVPPKNKAVVEDFWLSRTSGHSYNLQHPEKGLEPDFRRLAVPKPTERLSLVMNRPLRTWVLTLRRCGAARHSSYGILLNETSTADKISRSLLLHRWLLSGFSGVVSIWLR